MTKVTCRLGWTFTTILVFSMIDVGRSLAWDSKHGNPTRPTHTLLTNWGIDHLKEDFPELAQFRNAIVDGANTELHELKTSDKDIKTGHAYGVELEAKRIEHLGTNEGCDDVEGWWKESVEAYKSGQKDKAYFLLGVVLHMVEDMGVPAHANKVVHQGTITEFDNFEFMALSNWKPKFNDINKADPGFAEPWKYYDFSQKWTAEDAPDYKDRDSFSKTWTFASGEERSLLQNRQARTCHVVKWTLKSAAKALQ